jgi:hypothetical protein
MSTCYGLNFDTIKGRAMKVRRYKVKTKQEVKRMKLLLLTYRLHAGLCSALREQAQEVFNVKKRDNGDH